MGSLRLVQNFCTPLVAVALARVTQLKVATYPFTEEGERTRVFYTPTDHGGLSFSAMTPRQQSTAMRLLSATMSAGFYRTAATIMGLENILAGSEGFIDFVKIDVARLPVELFQQCPDRENGGGRKEARFVGKTGMSQDFCKWYVTAFFSIREAHHHEGGSTIRYGT